jgi:ABC-type nitrate/sulfonate/bicarbonate transport system substrate-binding protein
MRPRLLPSGLLAALTAATLAACAPTASTPAMPAAPSSQAAAPAGQPASAAPAAPPSKATITFAQTTWTPSYRLVYIADKKGLLAQRGIEVDLTTTNSSPGSLQGMVSGSYNFAGSTTDIGLRAIEKGTDIAALAGVARAQLYSLVVQPGISQVADLRGQKIGVSATAGGEVIFLKKMLGSAGIRDGDNELLIVGGTPQRFAALKADQIAGAALSQPEDFIALDSGLNDLWYREMTLGLDSTPEGMRAVIESLAESGELDNPQPPDAYMDLIYYREATRR